MWRCQLQRPVENVHHLAETVSRQFIIADGRDKAREAAAEHVAKRADQLDYEVQVQAVAENQVVGASQVNVVLEEAAKLAMVLAAEAVES